MSADSASFDVPDGAWEVVLHKKIGGARISIEVPMHWIEGQVAGKLSSTAPGKDVSMTAPCRILANRKRWKGRRK